MDLRTNEKSLKESSTVNFTDDAVGVCEDEELPAEMATLEFTKTRVGGKKEVRHWYVGVVSPRHEKKIADDIRQLGYEAFVPIQTVTRTWSQGRKRNVDVVLIPARIFIFATDIERLALLKYGLGIRCYLVNICGKMDEYGRRPLAIVPHSQMEQFQLQILQIMHMDMML